MKMFWIRLEKREFFEILRKRRAQILENTLRLSNILECEVGKKRERARLEYFPR